MFAGQNFIRDIIVLMGDPEYSKDKYTVPINDGAGFTKRCFFAPKLSLFVRKNLESGDLIRILKYSVDGKYLHLKSVCKVGAVSDPIGDPEGIADWVDDLNKVDNVSKSNPTPAITRLFYFAIFRHAFHFHVFLLY